MTVPDDAAAFTIVGSPPKAPRLHIVSRAPTCEGTRHIKDAGATAVVPPELEGALKS